MIMLMYKNRAHRISVKTFSFFFVVSIGFSRFSFRWFKMLYFVKFLWLFSFFAWVLFFINCWFISIICILFLWFIHTMFLTFMGKESFETLTFFSPCNFYFWRRRIFTYRDWSNPYFWERNLVPFFLRWGIN